MMIMNADYVVQQENPIALQNQNIHGNLIALQNQNIHGNLEVQVKKST